MVRSLNSLAIVLPLVLLPLTAASQDKPDFSGTWVLETASPQVPEVPREITIHQSVQRTDARGDMVTPYFNRITFEKHVAGQTTSESYEIGIVGGTVSGRNGQGGDPATRTLYQVKWIGRELAIETGSYALREDGSRRYSEREQLWSLDEAGRLKLQLTLRESEGRPVTIEAVYRRR